MYLILAEVSIWGQIGLVALGLVVGAIAGFFISRAVFKNQLKKNLVYLPLILRLFP